MMKAPKDPHRVLNLVIDLHQGGKNEVKDYDLSLHNKFGAASLTLANAIEDEIPTIITPNILYFLFLISRPNKDLIKALEEDAATAQTKYALTLERIEKAKNAINQIKSPKLWQTYRTKNTEFLLLLPKKFGQKHLFTIGLSNELTKIPVYKIEQLVKGKTYNPINIETLNKMIVNPSIAKRIYLTGHASYYPEWRSPEKSYAQLTAPQYISFLRHLDKTGGQFLYISTCWAGGLNLFKMHHEQIKESAKNIFSKVYVTYPIVVGALTEAPTKVSFEAKFKQFFGELDDFFNRRKKILHWVRKPFEKIVKAFAEKSLWNIPSIRFPGINQFFQAIQVDAQVQLITYPILLAHELAFKANKLPTQAFIIKDKKAILLYPSMVRVPIKIEGTVPYMISMIPGKAHHYIQELDAHNTSLDELVRKMFAEPVILSTKAFFIPKLRCKNFEGSGILEKGLFEFPFGPDSPSQDLELSNVTIYVEKTHYFNVRRHNLIIYFYVDAIKSYKKFGMTSVENLLPYPDITIDDAKKEIKAKLEKTRPQPALLTEASGGIENERQFEKLTKKYLSL